MAQATVSDARLNQLDQQGAQAWGALKAAFGQACADVNDWAVGHVERAAYSVKQNVKEFGTNVYGKAAGIVNDVEQGVTNFGANVASGVTGAVRDGAQWVADKASGKTDEIQTEQAHANDQYNAKAEEYGKLAEAEFSDVLSDGSNMRDRGYSSSMDGMGY